ncbi:MAG: PKD domain-containing protein, partial [Deltaproteobacteria bacterium]|nr:PKD domain-containing protein [Deltaproteobacteria bacterium]
MVISEINYNPSDPTPAEEAAGFVDNDDFEFIEILNVGATTVELSGVAITDGVLFTFGPDELPAGKSRVVVQDLAAFAFRYQPTPVCVVGEFTDGSLSNSGEQILLEGALGEILLDFIYADNAEAGWPTTPDGGGHTLESKVELLDEDTDFSDPNSWRASTVLHGTPCTAGEAPILGDLNGDGVADLADADFLALNWGTDGLNETAWFELQVALELPAAPTLAPITCVVDVPSRSTALLNADPALPATMDGYSIHSGDWISLEQQGYSGWREANPQPGDRLTEVGDPLVLEPDGFVNVGQAFSANPTESGTFSQFSGGQVTTSDVVFVVNQAPSASIDPHPMVAVLHEVVTLTASGSDADGHPILLEWTLTSPQGSSAQLADPSSLTASFTPDLPGNYVVTLLVSDPFGPSEPATLTIT